MAKTNGRKIDHAVRKLLTLFYSGALLGLILHLNVFFLKIAVPDLQPFLLTKVYTDHPNLPLKSINLQKGSIILSTPKYETLHEESIFIFRVP